MSHANLIEHEEVFRAKWPGCQARTASRTWYWVQLKQCQQHLSPSTYFLAWPTSQGREHTLSGGWGCPSLNWISARNMRVGCKQKLRPILNEEKMLRKTGGDLPDLFSRNSPSRYLPTRTHLYFPGSVCLKCMILYLAGPSPFLSNLNLSPLRP